MTTINFQLPANPADSGIARLSAEDTDGSDRVLEWVPATDGTPGLWHPINKRTGARTKVGMGWVTVLQTYSNVRKYVDPSAAAADAERAAVVEALQAMLNRYAAEGQDRELSGAVLADDVQAYIDGLRKLTTE